MSSPDVHAAVAAALGAERLRLVATLIRTTGDWDLAEDALADAVERALLTWPRDGVPDNPSAWLTTTARRRAIDLLRRAVSERRRWVRAAADVDADTDAESEAGLEPSEGDAMDDRLRLVLTCCHPALPLEGRVALTLKVVVGLTTAQVGDAFLVSEATMGQRLLRAKQKIARAGIPYRVPPADQLPNRLDGVLAVVYLVFTQGYAVTDDALADEAVRLGRLLVELVPDSDEVAALLALMLLQHSRREARVVDGELATLAEQDRGRWDRAAIAEATTLLATSRSASRGAYRVQAELAAVHATTDDPAATDWPRVVTLYDELLVLQPSPVVSLNRAVAVAEADGPDAGLAALDAVATGSGGERLATYGPWYAVRGELLARCGQPGPARAAFARAAALAPTPAQRRQIARRAAELS